MYFGKFGFRLASFCMILFAGVAVGAEESPAYRDLYADTWVAQDALGRNMPSFMEVGPVKTGQRRVVGMFYITWHSDGLGNGDGKI